MAQHAALGQTTNLTVSSPWIKHVDYIKEMLSFFVCKKSPSFLVMQIKMSDMGLLYYVVALLDSLNDSLHSTRAAHPSDFESNANTALIYIKDITLFFFKIFKMYSLFPSYCRYMWPIGLVLIKVVYTSTTSLLKTRHGRHLHTCCQTYWL